MENEQTLTGLELRKAVLEAAGFSVVIGESLVGRKGFYVMRPDGEQMEDRFFIYRDQDTAWKTAPAVESSVDAALRWLKLPDGLYWGLETPIDSNAHAYVSILDVDAEMVEDTSGQYMNVPLARANHPSLAVAMCQAYLAWKAGA